jgi:hypothetical protein
MEIVTLIPSATKIVAFLGQKKSIIGRSHECAFSDDLSNTIKLTEPKISYFVYVLNTPIEKIIITTI